MVSVCPPSKVRGFWVLGRTADFIGKVIYSCVVNLKFLPVQVVFMHLLAK